MDPNRTPKLRKSKRPTPLDSRPAANLDLVKGIAGESLRTGLDKVRERLPDLPDPLRGMYYLG